MSIRTRLRSLWKRKLPTTLFGRVLLILVLPTVLIQMVMAYVFFDRHWDNVSRHMSNTLAGEMAFFIRQIKAAPDETHAALAEDFESATGIDVFFAPQESFQEQPENEEFPEFQHRLHAKIKEPFSVRKIQQGNTLEVSVLMAHQVVRMETTVKRLESRTTLTFVLWMLGASITCLWVAVLFLRNQIRPIWRLAEAADNFGRGVDTPDFRPSGAKEVRKASRAFIVMRERITRQMRIRTEMLAGISHDLRTPLTRMKLELAMLPPNPATRESIEELNNDVSQMEHMIKEYLDFARGEGREEAVRVSLRDMLLDVVSDYHRQQAKVTLVDGEDRMADIRISGFRRMLHNVIDNALRYGKEALVSLNVAANYCEIVIDDNGPGIPEAQREDVFKPFNRLDPSRNIKTGGVGLGLTIARDIALTHGGTITLDNAPRGGLRVNIRLPL